MRKELGESLNKSSPFFADTDNIEVTLLQEHHVLKSILKTLIERKAIFIFDKDTESAVVIKKVTGEIIFMSHSLEYIEYLKDPFNGLQLLSVADSLLQEQLANTLDEIDYDMDDVVIKNP